MVSQSCREILFSGELTLEVSITKYLTGNGKRVGGMLENAVQAAKRRRCIISINNPDKSCGYRALALVKLLADTEVQPDNWEYIWKCARTNKTRYQERLLEQFCRDYDVCPSIPA